MNDVQKRIFPSAVALLLFSTLLAACGDGTSPSNGAAGTAPGAASTPAPAEDHNYVLADDTEYGYEPGLSNDDQAAGKKSKSLMMFRYAGERDGKHQVFQDKDSYILVLECSKPCEFIKEIEINHGRVVNVERIRAAPGMLGTAIMEDAINGKLEPSKLNGGKKGNEIWFDEKRGMILTAIK